MKLANVIMILIVVQASILLYDNVLSTGGEDAFQLSAYDSNESIIWNFIVNPGDWSGTDLLSLFGGLIGLVGAIGVGVYLYTKSDTVLFFGVFMVLLGFGSIPILALYDVITRDLGLYGCTAMTVTNPCFPALFVWIFTGGVLGLLYVLACLEWWSGRSTG